MAQNKSAWRAQTCPTRTKPWLASVSIINYNHQHLNLTEPLTHEATVTHLHKNSLERCLQG